MDRDTVRRSFIGGAGLFCIVIALSSALAVLDASRNPPAGSMSGVISAAVFAVIGLYLLRIRRRPAP